MRSIRPSRLSLAEVERDIIRERTQAGLLAARARGRNGGRPKALTRKKHGSRLHGWVRDRLVHFRWSPEQIAGRLKAMEPDDPGSRVSHETIYAAIYAHPRGGLKAAMIEALRQAKPSR